MKRRTHPPWPRPSVLMPRRSGPGWLAGAGQQAGEQIETGSITGKAYWMKEDTEIKALAQR